MLKTEIPFKILNKPQYTWDQAHSHHKAGRFYAMDRKIKYLKILDLKLAYGERSSFSVLADFI